MGSLSLRQVGNGILETMAPSKFTTSTSRTWVTAGIANWGKVKNMSESTVRLSDLTAMPDWVIPQKMSERRTEHYIKALASLSTQMTETHWKDMDNGCQQYLHLHEFST